MTLIFCSGKIETCQQFRFIVENVGTVFTENSKEQSECSGERREYFIGHNSICVEEQRGNEKNRAEMHKVCTIMKNTVDTFIHFFY